MFSCLTNQVHRDIQQNEIKNGTGHIEEPGCHEVRGRVIKGLIWDNLVKVDRGDEDDKGVRLKDKVGREKR